MTELAVRRPYRHPRALGSSSFPHLKDLSHRRVLPTHWTTVTPVSETLSSVLVNQESQTVTFVVRTTSDEDKERFADVLGQVGPTIARLVMYDEGWDSYGGSRISPDAAEVVLQLLLETSAGWPSPPSIVPGSDGSLQIEWHMPAGEIEIEVAPSRRSSVFYRLPGAEEWDVPLDKVRDDLPALLSRLRMP